MSHILNKEFEEIRAQFHLLNLSINYLKYQSKNLYKLNVYNLEYGQKLKIFYQK